MAANCASLHCSWLRTEDMIGTDARWNVDRLGTFNTVTTTTATTTTTAAVECSVSNMETDHQTIQTCSNLGRAMCEKSISLSLVIWWIYLPIYTIPGRRWRPHTHYHITTASHLSRRQATRKAVVPSSERDTKHRCVNWVELQTHLRDVWSCIITEKAHTRLGPFPGWDTACLLVPYYICVVSPITFLLIVG